MTKETLGGSSADETIYKKLELSIGKVRGFFTSFTFNDFKKN
jgi:hypothetical protein